MKTKPPTADSEPLPPLRYLDEKEGAELFDRHAWNLMGMSGKEFLERYDRGEFKNGHEDSRIVKLEMLIPFGESLRNGRSNTR